MSARSCTSADRAAEGRHRLRRRPRGCGSARSATDGYTPMYVNAEVVADTDGQVAALVEAIVANAGARARDELDELYDGYLNCFVRSLKAWRRGDELGGRMQAAESCSTSSGCSSPRSGSCSRTTISCAAPLRELERLQGWEEGFLVDALTARPRDRRPDSPAGARAACRGALRRTRDRAPVGAGGRPRPVKEHRFR